MWVQGILQEQMWVQDVVQNVGSGNPPRRADVELEVILPPGLDLADGHAKEVVAELGRMAAKTPSRSICRSELATGRSEWIGLWNSTLELATGGSTCSSAPSAREWQWAGQWAGNGNGPVDWGNQGCRMVTSREGNSPRFAGSLQPGSLGGHSSILSWALPVPCKPCAWLDVYSIETKPRQASREMPELCQK